MSESSEKIEEKVSEYFAVSLDYDVDSLSSLAHLFDSLKEHCTHMAGENNYYREELSRRFFEIYTNLNVIGLNLDLLHFTLIQYVSRVKILMTQDKKPDVDISKFNGEVKQTQEKIQKNLLLLHEKLLQLTQDLQKEAKENFNGSGHRKEPL